LAVSIPGLNGGDSIRRNRDYDQVRYSLEYIELEWIEVCGVLPSPVLSPVNKA